MSARSGQTSERICGADMGSRSKLSRFKWVKYLLYYSHLSTVICDAHLRLGRRGRQQPHRQGVHGFDHIINPSPVLGISNTSPSFCPTIQSSASMCPPRRYTQNGPPTVVTIPIGSSLYAMILGFLVASLLSRMLYITRRPAISTRVVLI